MSLPTEYHLPRNAPANYLRELDDFKTHQWKPTHILELQDLEFAKKFFVVYEQAQSNWKSCLNSTIAFRRFLFSPKLKEVGLHERALGLLVEIANHVNAIIAKASEDNPSAAIEVAAKQCEWPASITCAPRLGSKLEQFRLDLQLGSQAAPYDLYRSLQREAKPAKQIAIHLINILDRARQLHELALEVNEWRRALRSCSIDSESHIEFLFKTAREYRRFSYEDLLTSLREFAALLSVNQPYTTPRSLLQLSLDCASIGIFNKKNLSHWCQVSKKVLLAFTDCTPEGNNFLYSNLGIGQRDVKKHHHEIPRVKKKRGATNVRGGITWQIKQAMKHLALERAM